MKVVTWGVAGKHHRGERETARAEQVKVVEEEDEKEEEEAEEAEDRRAWWGRCSLLLGTFLVGVRQHSKFVVT